MASSKDAKSETDMAYTSGFESECFKDRLKHALAEAEASDLDGVRAATLRLVLCAVKDRDATARAKGECEGCPEAAVRQVLETMAAQREISAREYDEAGRISDAEREREELQIIKEFLPRPLIGEALETAVKSVVEELEASKLKDVGRCMSALKARYPGQVDSGSAGKAIRAALG